MPERRHTAYHEAGHAVIGLVLGYDVRKATIRPRYSYLGSAWISNERNGSTEIQAGSDSEVDLVGRICVGLAGLFAEQLVSRAPLDELIDDSAWTDWQRAQKNARRINRRKAEMLIDVLMEETKALVQQHRQAIIRVAEALLERWTLTGEEIKQLVNRSVS
jgi:cell division protease FtsH